MMCGIAYMLLLRLRGSAARAYSERSIAGGGPWGTLKSADRIVLVLLGAELGLPLLQHESQQLSMERWA